MGFQIIPLDIDQFSHLFGQDRKYLAKQGVQRVLADSNPGFPCRVSLQDAKVGESLLLLNYEHQSLPTPFRSSHAIFVRESAILAELTANEIPDMFRHRLLSVRTFDDSGMMIDADVVEGTGLAAMIEYLLSNEAADFLHIHNAKPGCFAASARRA